jgi:hypothetical protein
VKAGKARRLAAMIYLLGSDERQRVIAESINKVAAAELRRSRSRRSGTERARGRRTAS